MRRQILAGLIAFGLSAVAHAIPIQYHFQTLVDTSAYGGSTTDSLSYEVTVDTDAPVIVRNSQQSDRIGLLNANIGSETFSTNVFVQVIDRDAGSADVFRVFFGSAFQSELGVAGTVFGENIVFLDFRVEDLSGSIFSDQNLPSSLDLDDFGRVGYYLSFGSRDLFNHYNDLMDSPQVSLTAVTNAVPEPTTLVLLIAGLLVLPLKFRRNQVSK